MFTMPRSKGALVIAVLLLGLASSCSRKPIVIGAPLGLTGLTSSIGLYGRNGMEIAIDELNAGGGVRVGGGKPRRIELAVVDDHDDADGALAADESLRAKGAVALIGHMSSSAASKAIAYATEHELPLISPTASSTDFSGLDDYFFRVIGPNDSQGRILAEEAIRRGYRRAAAVYNSVNRAYTLAVCSGFKKAFEAAGGVMLEPHPTDSPSGTDYGAVADALVADRPDVILYAASSYDLASLRQALAKRGPTIPGFGSMWTRTPDLFTYGGRTVEGVVLTGSADATDPTPTIAAFRAEHLRRFGEEPVFASMYAYESVMMLAEALNRAENLSGPAIKKALLDGVPFRGLQGEFSLDPYGDVSRPYLLYEVRDGAFRLLSR